jgi:hypothetical protein
LKGITASALMIFFDKDSILVATTAKGNFGQLIFELPPTILRIVRKIESLSKKIINAEAAISFTKISLSDINII